MKSTFRTILFWMHLVSGVVAGLIIGIMSLTGAMLAFEPQIIDWADRAGRQVEPPAPDAPRLAIDEMTKRVQETMPDAQISGVTEYADPKLAVLVNTGRNEGFYVNPYTGQVQPMGAKGARAFLHQMEEWHRWLGTKDENRGVGRAITGVCNAAFLFLAISGLYLWWPRKWTWRTVRPVIWFRGGLKGKARDFNWHNTAGFWTLPVIIVLTASGMVMSYKWASDLIFKLTGNEPPANQGPFAQPTVKVPEPPEGARPLSFEPLFAEARKQSTAWESISLRLGGPPRGNAQRAPQAGGPPQEGRPREGRPVQEGSPSPEGGARAERPRGDAGGPQRGGPQARTFSIKEQGGWPLFASTQVSLDPFTAQVLRREGFADYNSGRQLRTWLRFLHTGEALGWAGQLVACIASLGGAFLMWTGLTLSWRRFFRRGSRVASSEESPSAVQPETTA